MYSPRSKLPMPSDFQFPYKDVYDIQQQLMEAVFRCLEEKKVGIFESPTGTGKSLTLTCSALCWLEAHEALVRCELQERIEKVQLELNALIEESGKCTDWLTTQHQVREQREELKTLQSMRELLEEHERRLALMQQQVKERRQQSKRATHYRRTVDVLHENLKDAIEEDDLIDDKERNADDDDDNEAKAAAKDNNEENSYKGVQIFFCSRTHSQLAQVLREVKRTAYGKSMRCISLASRQQLCINPAVRSLHNVAAINERCLDMARRGNSKKTGNTTTAAEKPTAIDGNGCTLKKSRSTQLTDACKCPYKTASAVQELHEYALCHVQDIEELVTEAQATNACPYYATRAAAQSAQLIMLPYQLLLHRRTRQQSGINLRGAIVIIDEAHNLLDTIAQLYSCELTLVQLNLIQQQIAAYKKQYAKRFSATNLLRINQLLFITKRLIDLLQPTAQQEHSSVRMLNPYELSAEGEFYNIDLHQLLEFCERMRFAQKLHGFAQNAQRMPQPTEQAARMPHGKDATLHVLQRLHKQQQCEQNNIRKKNTTTTTHANSADEKEEKDQKENVQATDGDRSDKVQQIMPIRVLLRFLEALTESNEDGRVLVNIDVTTAQSSSFKYLLLNPGSHFFDILRDARSIIVAGGTMQPTDELTHQLFHSCPERVTQHFYGHVVAADAVLPLTIGHGPTGKKLCFNYTQRRSIEMMSELSRCLLNFCNVIPAGVVCFLPSYDYLADFYKYLQHSGMLRAMSNKKTVFYESRKTHNVEQLLADYSRAVQQQRRSDGIDGALLFSVVGGKLSEGLNFADDLGRGVIVVGLPYANRSPELLERQKYLDAKLGIGAGADYYENLCMKAVNQCIGRSVRHRADYACVCLLDERYVSIERVRKKLPHWIARSLQPASVSSVQQFGLQQAAIAKYFKQKRTKN